MMKNLRVIVGIIALLIAGSVNAQNVDFKGSNFKDDKDGLKAAVEAIKQGDEFYEQGVEDVFQTKMTGDNFKKAISFYIKAQKFNPDNAELNFKLGVCYANTSQKYRAPKHINRAVELGHKDNFLPYYQGLCLQFEGKYDEAVKSYTTFETEYRKADKFSKYVSKKKKECRIAKEMEADPKRVWVDNVAELNSADDDINPSISTDGEQIIFSSSRMNGKKMNDVGEYDLDIYASIYSDGKWGKPEALKGAINSDIDDYAANLSYDGTKMLMYKKEGDNFDVYESFLRGSSWSAPENFSKNINNSMNQTYAAYYNDKRKVFYLVEKVSANLAGRGSDIYFTAPIDRTTRQYGDGASVGSDANSKFHEGSVYMHPDGKTMYFSSEGHNSMGGMDIFVSKFIQGKWTAPENLGYPINTPYDDMVFAITASGKYAYISSNRAGGKGGYDIYKVTYWGPDKPLLVDTEDLLLASSVNPIQDNTIKSAKTVDRKSLTVFKGKTIDALTKKPVEANIEIIDNAKGKQIDELNTNSATGKFLVSLLAGKNYGIAVKADGYLFHSENFDIPDGSDYNLVNKVIELKNVKVGSKIALRNIFFETAKATLKEESNNELDRLVKLMKDVPSLKVEISGHTDNTGSAKLNDKLSQDRAQSVVDYLTNNGISSSRLTAKGYGSNEPVADNGTAAGRQENRRVEFKITGN